MTNFIRRGQIGLLLASLALVLVFPVMASAQTAGDVTDRLQNDEDLKFDCTAVKDITGDVVQGGVLAGVNTKCIQCGACELCDFLNVGYQLAKMIFAIMGAVAFAFVIYGGVLFVASAGSSDAIEKGKTTLRNAVIGLFIVAFAWQIVYAVLVFVGTPKVSDISSSQVIFNFQWDKPPCTADAQGFDEGQIKSFEETNQATGTNPPAGR